MAIPTEVTRAFVSSAIHKQDAFVEHALSIDPSASIILINKPKRSPEPDIADPEKTAIGKTIGFLATDEVKEQLFRRKPYSVTVADVLFYLQGGDKVLTTDREGDGAAITLAQFGEYLAETTAGLPPQIMIQNTTGTMFSPRIYENSALWLDSDVLAVWATASLTLAPAFVELFAKPDKFFDLHKRGVIGDGLIKPESIEAINWPTLVMYAPAICSVLGKHYWMEIAFGKQDYHYIDGSTGVLPRVVKQLNDYTRGFPGKVVQKIMRH